MNGKPKDQITAFIVEMDWPGVEVMHRCHFMGLKALYNGVIHFTNVRVPAKIFCSRKAKVCASR